jgi:hypothetical protein
MRHPAVRFCGFPDPRQRKYLLFFLILGEGLPVRLVEPAANLAANGPLNSRLSTARSSWTVSPSSSIGFSSPRQ